MLHLTRKRSLSYLPGQLPETMDNQKSQVSDNIMIFFYLWKVNPHLLSMGVGIRTEKKHAVAAAGGRRKNEKKKKKKKCLITPGEVVIKAHQAANQGIQDSYEETCQIFTRQSLRLPGKGSLERGDAVVWHPSNSSRCELLRLKLSNNKIEKAWKRKSHIAHIKKKSIFSVIIIKGNMHITIFSKRSFKNSL